MRTVAHEQFPIIRRQRHARTEPAERRNGLHQALRTDPVNLARLPARPSETGTIERETLGMIETAREYFEAVNRNFG